MKAYKSKNELLKDAETGEDTFVAIPHEIAADPRKFLDYLGIEATDEEIAEVMAKFGIKPDEE